MTDLCIFTYMHTDTQHVNLHIQASTYVIFQPKTDTNTSLSERVGIQGCSAATENNDNLYPRKEFWGILLWFSTQKHGNNLS